MCHNRSVDLRFFGVKERLGKHIGKDIRSVIAILDRGFAGRLLEMIDEQKIENGGELNGKSKSI